jgi:pimeloyl-ACP methyl ester carboxylesterase
MAMPKDHSNLNAGKFVYTYEYRKIDPKLPTLIHLPGGPGARSVGEDILIPDSFNVIYSDPRGIGCNLAFEQDLPGGQMTTLQSAYDILAIIKREKLSNCYIHGHSYGTAMATVVADLLARFDFPPPKAIVLEGVLNRAFGSYKEMMDGYAGVASIILARNPTIADLFQKDEDLPLGLPSEYWASFLMWDLILIDEALARLEKLLSPNSKAYEEAAEYFMQDYEIRLASNFLNENIFQFDFTDYTQKKIICDEILGSLKGVRGVLEKGRLSYVTR